MLNRDTRFKWVVVDNSETPVLQEADMAGCAQLVTGLPRPKMRDRGSMHHAMALEQGLSLAESRFVLLLDHDFYILQRGWIDCILAHMQQQELVLFGSVWHPRWFYQYRGFPTVHCMFIDTDRFRQRDLKLRPLINGDKWWNFINNENVPLPLALRNTFKARRIRDTGWQIYDACKHGATIRYETLTPHYVRPTNARARWEEHLSRFLPSSWMVYPTANDSYTTSSLLKAQFPAAYALGWEEFFWQSEPFGIHLRRVGRAMTDDPHSEDRHHLEVLIDNFEADNVR